jgi:hypothetical protein
MDSSVSIDRETAWLMILAGPRVSTAGLSGCGQGMLLPALLEA